MIEQRGFSKAPPAPQMFGNAGVEVEKKCQPKKNQFSHCTTQHMEKYGTTAAQIAKIAEKNHRHSGEFCIYLVAFNFNRHTCFSKQSLFSIS